jgi:hypothetical protein
VGTRSAGGKGKLALLERHQAGSGERIVLTGRGQVPTGDGQLPRRSNHRDLRSAPCFDPVEERPQWSWCAGGYPRRLDQHDASLRTTGLGDVTMTGRLISGLPNLRMQTQVSHQFLGRGKPPEITDGSNHRHPDHRIDSGDGHQAADHRIGERLDRRFAFCGDEFAAEKIQLP